MLIKLKQLLDKDISLLMAVYQESNKANIAHFFPELKDIDQGLQMVENAYTEWLRTDFLSKDNTTYYVWMEKGIWISALRFHQVSDTSYFIEALETHPNYRKLGYAEKLINAITEELKNRGGFEIQSYTSIRNIASQKTHEKCGFVEIAGRPFDYTTQEYVDNAVGFLYKYQLAN